MADRFFQNVMPDFVPENPNVNEAEENGGRIGSHPQGTEESLLRLVSLPYATLSPQFQRAALDLKETILVDTWGITEQRVEDFTLYTGTLGTAFLLFKSFQVTQNKNDLSLCLEIIKACDSSSIESRDVTFICGRAGVCALGAVVAKYVGDDQLLQDYLAKFKEIKLSNDHPDELLYGRAGYLWTCLYLNKHLGKETIPSTFTDAIVREVIKNGRKLGKREGSPLMFEWYGEKYWGAAHGLAGIMHVLMEFELTSDELEDVKGTLRYMIRNRFPSGDYPVSEDDKSRDVLVHWCHGAPGIALTLIKAAEIFGDKEFLRAAMDAVELTGIVEYLYRAKAFACFLLDRAHMLMTTGEMHGGDNVSSLFEGVAGMAHLFLDMVQPTNARFPAYDF